MEGVIKARSLKHLRKLDGSVDPEEWGAEKDSNEDLEQGS